MNTKKLDEIKQAIIKAGEETLKFYDNPEVEYKENDSPVTKADLASEKIVLEALQKTGLPILSEETEDDLSRLGSKKAWIVDPLDGTKDFIQKTGDFSIMVGLVENGRPILGLVYSPSTKELFYAEKNKGAFVEIDEGESQRLQVSGIENSKEARMVVSRNHLKPEDKAVGDFLKVASLEKRGSNGLKIGSISSGETEFFINTTSKMGEWDFCGPEIILTEAGGMMTDIKGDILIYNKKNPRMKTGLVASNGKFHDKIIKAINKIKKRHGK